MRTAIIIALLMITSIGWSQRISSVFSFNVPIGGMIHYKQNYYSPQNYFRIYMVNVPGETNEKFNRFSVLGFGKWFASSGIAFGYSLKIDYKRLGFRIGYKANFRHTNIRFNQLSDSYSLTEVADKYPVQFKMEAFHHQFPLLVSVDLKRQNNSPFLIGGVEFGYMFAKIETTDWNNDVHYNRYKIAHLYNIFYDNSPYMYGVFGGGIKNGRFEWLLNFKYRMDNAKHQLSTDEVILDFQLNAYVGSKTIRKKHYLYEHD